MESDQEIINLYFAGKRSWYAVCDQKHKIKERTNGSDEIDGLAKLLRNIPNSANIYTISKTLQDLDFKNHENPIIRRKVNDIYGCRETHECFVYAQSLCAPKHPRDILAKDWYSESVAILIGINDYYREKKLNYCLADVDLMESCLKKRKFKTIVLKDKDATKENIQRQVLDGASRIHKDGRLLIFFAGHGDGDMKSILPYDFDPASPYATSLPMKNFGHDFPSVVPKHTLLILDCCYSGNVAERGFSKGQLQDHLQKKAFDALTAGQTDQKAREEDGNGVFTKALVEGLEGSAFKETDEWITTSELWQHVLNSLATRNLNQTPQHFRIGLDKEGADGMFVFEHPNSEMTKNN